MSIYVTGDIHGTQDLKKITPEQWKQYRPGDTLIICGDFGLIWSNGYNPLEDKYLKLLSSMPIQICFIDGSHENFNRLENDYPKIAWKGGYVHRIRDNIFHLIRGNIYTIENKNIFCLGGGCTIDTDKRIINRNYWKRESIDENDIAYAWNNLRRYHNQVDIVITHTCPISFAVDIVETEKDKLRFQDKNLAILEEFYKKITFKKWYFGCWHKDRKVGNEGIAVFKLIHKI